MYFACPNPIFFRQRFAPPSEMNTTGRHWAQPMPRLQFYCQILLEMSGNAGWPAAAGCATYELSCRFRFLGFLVFSFLFLGLGLAF